MNAKLVVMKGAKKATIRLRLPTVIGRSPDASVKVPSDLVSRKHCEITSSGGQLLVSDLGSSNGTFVNGEKIEEPTLLFEDDLLRVGPVIMQVTVEEASEEDGSSKSVPSPSATAAKQPEAGADASSVLKYRETDEGSFVGIAEFDDDLDDEVEDEVVDNFDDEIPAEPVEGQSAVDALGKMAGSEAAPSAGGSAVNAIDDLVEEKPKKIGSDDSALGDFFKGLG